MKYADAFIFPGQGIADSAAAVRGSVIHQKKLPVVKALGQDPVNGGCGISGGFVRILAASADDDVSPVRMPPLDNCLLREFSCRRVAPFIVVDEFLIPDDFFFVKLPFFDQLINLFRKNFFWLSVRNIADVYIVLADSFPGIKESGSVRFFLNRKQRRLILFDIRSGI